MGVSYVYGLQSTRCTAMPKHFICNDWENNRKNASSDVPERTLREIYAMPFEYCVKEGKAWSIMSAHNQVRVLPSQANMPTGPTLATAPWCSQNSYTLTTILKQDWGLRGYVCSDYNSIFDPTMSANAGEDVQLPLGDMFGDPLKSAVLSGTVPQSRVDDMAKRILRTKVWAGVIGKLGTAVTKYQSDLMSTAAKQVCYDAACKSIVLVKNDGVLPLNKTTVNMVAVVGPYNGPREGGAGSGEMAPCESGIIGPLAGITAKIGAAKVTATNWQAADVVIVCIGVSGEGEGTDRTTITLEPPTGQISLINQILAANKKLIVVMTGGSACTKDVWANGNAVIIAWYPGQRQGDALADILFGDVNPSGKISSTWPVSADQLPPFLNSPTINNVSYEGPDTGRGYRYYDKKNLTPLYAFGFGLSYTTFQYSNIRISPNPAAVGQNVTVTVSVQNTGTRPGDEVAQLYIHEVAPQLPRPVKELRGFARVSLAAGASSDVSFTLRERELAYFDDRTAAKRFVCQPDGYDIMVGPASNNLPLKATLTVQ
jgi:beta-glucosidase